MTMYHVTLFQTPESPHLSQPLAGLVMLEQLGRVTLTIAPPDNQVRRLSIQHTLWLRVHTAANQKERGAGVLVCLDMLDGGDFDPRAVAAADSYFKRSYDGDVHAELDIQPYGLNFACTSDNPRHDFDLQRRLMRRAGRLRFVFANLFFKLGVTDPKSTIQLPISCFERDAGEPTQPGVVFVPKLWSADEAPGVAEDELHQINNMRVETVEALRQAFGSQFFGGVEDGELARQLAPKLVFDSGSKQTYLRNMQQRLIGVASVGLHGSVGWKFAEYLAAARCVVSEPLNFSPAQPVLEGEHYLRFATPDECVIACQRLLENPSLAENMRQANAAYYTQAMRPDKLAQRCLEVASSSSSGERGERVERGERGERA